MIFPKGDPVSLVLFAIQPDAAPANIATISGELPIRLLLVTIGRTAEDSTRIASIPSPNIVVPLHCESVP